MSGEIVQLQILSFFNACGCHVMRTPIYINFLTEFPNDFISVAPSLFAQSDRNLKEHGYYGIIQCHSQV